MGATLSGSGTGYDGINRAGVTDVRYSQFRPDVVRVAIYLEDQRDYRVERDGDAIRVSFGSDQSFLAWSSRAPSQLEPPPAPSRAAAAPAPEVTPPETAVMAKPVDQQPRITVTWDKADISDVVAGFAAFSGKTIVLGKDIKGNRQRRDQESALARSVRGGPGDPGAAGDQLPGGIIRVDSPGALAALDSIEPLQTRLVRVNYATASSLIRSVEPISDQARQGGGRHHINSLIITDTRTRMSDIERTSSRGLDIRTPQVSIQSKIIFVDRTDVQSWASSTTSAAATSSSTSWCSGPTRPPGIRSTRTPS